MNFLNPLKVTGAVVFLAACASTAQAGEWRLNLNACPDLREDRIDRRVTTGARDLREDRRDARTVNCPASAWTYVPSRGERIIKAPRLNQARTVVYVDRGRYFYSPKRDHRNLTQIKVVVR